MENHYNCIYMYTNLINGKRYVGKAKDFNTRHKQHLDGKKQLIDKKIKEYGIENFSIEILAEDIDDSKIDDYEKFFIKRKRSHVSLGEGYNRTWGGDGGNTISGYTEEQRKEHSRKMSEMRKGENNPMYGKHLSEEHKQKQSKSLKGKPKSEEAIRKQSEAIKGEKHWNYGKPSPMRGKKMNEESRQKMSDAKKDKYIGDKNPRARKIICIETSQVYTTIKEATEWIGKGDIYRCLRDNTKTAGKHPITKESLHWMYYEDYLKLQEQEEQQNKSQDLVTEVA